MGEPPVLGAEIAAPRNDSPPQSVMCNSNRVSTEKPVTSSSETLFTADTFYISQYLW